MVNRPPPTIAFPGPNLSALGPSSPAQVTSAVRLTGTMINQDSRYR